MSSSDADRYRLSEARHEQIFSQKIVSKHLAHAFNWQQPTLYALGGQPGAGKSKSASAIVPLTPERHGNAATIDADVFREHHPRYPVLQQENDATAAFYTDTDARLWVNKAINYAIEHRLNVVLDAPLANPDRAQLVLARFREASRALVRA